ncbi:MAG: hypothetical protein ACI9KN_001745 [Gammaproteobacteria bacterium]
MRNSYFSILVPAFLFIRYLVFDLQAASARFDHLLGHQVSRFGVTKASVNVGNNRHDMRFVIVDLKLYVSCLCRVAGLLVMTVTFLT